MKWKVEIGFPPGPRDLHVGDFSSWLIYRFYYQEPVIWKFFKRCVKSGMDVLNIGAHVGIHVPLLSSLVGESGRVFAFEPTPRTFQLLTKNCELLGNVGLYEEAVTDKHGETVRMTGFRWGLFSLWNTLGDYGRFLPPTSLIVNGLLRERFSVKTVSIDSWVRENPAIKPGVIIVDAENWEYKVLFGGMSMIMSCKPIIIFEGGDIKRSISTRKVIDLLIRIGYEIFELSREGNLVEHIPQRVYKYHINLIALPK